MRNGVIAAGLMLLWSMVCSAPVRAQIIEVAGSTTVKALMEPAVAAYKKRRPDVIIHVRGGGSGVGAAAMIDDRASIGMMSREPEADEVERMDKLGIKRVRIAYDAVVVVISDHIYHRGGVHALKMTDVAGIYRGEIRNWQAVGGPDRRILVLDKEKSRGTRHVFAHFILGDARADSTPDAVVLGSNRDMRTLLIASDQAIGFLPFGAVDDDKTHAVALLHDGKHSLADQQSVRNGSYPLTRSLYLLYREDAPAYVHAFIDYLRSKAVAPIIRQVGYLPLQ